MPCFIDKEIEVRREEIGLASLPSLPYSYPFFSSDPSIPTHHSLWGNVAGRLLTLWGQCLRPANRLHVQLRPCSAGGGPTQRRRKVHKGWTQLSSWAAPSLTGKPAQRASSLCSSVLSAKAGVIFFKKHIRPCFSSA